MDVVALSGGKDSSAMALLLRDREPRDYVYVCTPTGDELPEWWHHMRTMRDLLGKPVIPVVGGTLKGLCDKWQALPNWRQRWCTRKLKIEPFAAWLMQQPRPIVSYVGLRADEPERDGGDYSAVPGVDIRYPLREWGVNEADVLAYLEQRGAIITYLPWLLSVITIWMTVLAGNKHPSAWFVGLANQALWLGWIIASSAWGLLPMNIALWIVYGRNHLKWSGEKGAVVAPPSQ